MESALKTGEFERVVSWDEHQLRVDASFAAAPLLAHARGFGYWSWKPHIILDALGRVPVGDVVVYCDAGRYFGGFTIDRSVAPLVDFARRHDGIFPGVAVANFGPNARWTRRECFALMDCDSPRYWACPQVQASFSLWLKTPRSIEFLEEWRSYCADLRIVGDGENSPGHPNLPGFVDHRHDQSILTNLVVKHRVKPFRIQGRLYERFVSLTPNSLAANLFARDINNVSAVAAGTSPAILYMRALLGSKLSPMGRAEARRWR